MLLNGSISGIGMPRGVFVGLQRRLRRIVLLAIQQDKGLHESER
jgi:hypothetical protein